MTKKKEKPPSERVEVTMGVEEVIQRYKGEAAKGKHTMKFRSGVEVKLLRLPPLLVQRLDEQFKEPDPPMVEVEVHGEKQLESNPNDPDYLAERERIRRIKGLAYLRLAFLKGLDVDMPKDEEWLEELRLAGVEVGETKAAKKLAYIESVVITDASELEEVVNRVLAVSGVVPAAVEEATKTVSG